MKTPHTKEQAKAVEELLKTDFVAVGRQLMREQGWSEAAILRHERQQTRLLRRLMPELEAIRRRRGDD